MKQEPRIVNQMAETQPKAANKHFWKFRNLGTTDVELLLYGNISQTSWWGDEVTDKQFAEELNALGNVQNITVRINSGGGDVFAAQAIGNLLEQSKASTTAIIDGVCGSAATIVACHCGKVIAAEDSTYMIHPAAIGMDYGYYTKAELENRTKALDTIRENIINLYARKTGRKVDEVAALMDATSWWTGQQAKDEGFVDEVTAPENPAQIENRNGMLFVNSIGMGVPFDKAPEFVRSRMGKKTPGGFYNAKNPEKTGEQENSSMEIKNKSELASAYPDMVNEIKKDAAVDAITRERSRIKDIQDMTLPGMEKIMDDALYGEHPMDATEYAKEVAKFARQKAQDRANGMREDAKNSGANGVKSGGEEQPDSYLDALRSIGKQKQ